MSRIHLPLLRLSSEQWLKLALVTLAILYVIFAGGSVWAHSLFGYAGKVLLAFPVFANLFFGQVSIWLLIPVGEFLLSVRREQEESQ